MNTRSVDSLNSFLSDVEFLMGLMAHTVLFRGQVCKGNLNPGIARPNPKEDTTGKEKKVLEQFDLMGSTLLSGVPPHSLEMMVLAQHYGLRTRLLDWTSNPLAALWFACSAKTRGNAYVYSLEADNFLREGVYSKDPFSHTSTRAFQPRLNNQRISAQHGWFTLHAFSKRSACFVPLEKNSVSKKYLSEFVIPESKRYDMLLSLERCGVSQRTLFPDLDGLCGFLNMKHALG